ncbi:MAG: exosortase/archaeosortase family protein [Ilumatobacteraceae bacterium]
MERLGNRSAGLSLRLAAAAAAWWIGFSVSIDRWRSMETAVAVRLLHLVGVESPVSVGDQIIAIAAGGHGFSVNISQSCSSLGPVAAFGAFAAIVARGDRRRRWFAFAISSALVVVCNLARVGATVSVGVRSGPDSIQRFHDGVANWFAVAFVLAAFGLFVWALPRRREWRQSKLQAVRVAA